MAFWNSKSESDADRSLRRHSEALREERTQVANDARREQGQPPMHCGVVASTNSAGDSVCGRCGDIF